MLIPAVAISQPCAVPVSWRRLHPLSNASNVTKIVVDVGCCGCGCPPPLPSPARLLAATACCQVDFSRLEEDVWNRSQPRGGGGGGGYDRDVIGSVPLGKGREFAEAVALSTGRTVMPSSDRPVDPASRADHVRSLTGRIHALFTDLDGGEGTGLPRGCLSCVALGPWFARLA